MPGILEIFQLGPVFHLPVHEHIARAWARASDLTPRHLPISGHSGRHRQHAGLDSEMDMRGTRQGRHWDRTVGSWTGLHMLLHASHRVAWALLSGAAWAHIVITGLDIGPGSGMPNSG